MKLAIAIACLLSLTSCNTLGGAWLRWYQHKGGVPYFQLSHTINF